MKDFRANNFHRRKVYIIANDTEVIEQAERVESILKTADRFHEDPVAYYQGQRSWREDGRLEIFFLDMGKVELFEGGVRWSRRY